MMLIRIRSGTENITESKQIILSSNIFVVSDIESIFLKFNSMRRILFISFSLFLFSCAVKPDVTEEQIEQYNYCKQILLENKEAFIAKGKTKEKRDSLATYINDIEQNALPELLQKYEAEQEQIPFVLLSICQNADAILRNDSVSNVKSQ
ncbi:hypothetical protein BH11BAC7_BH11BAC7_16580 [soil metagenome]